MFCKKVVQFLVNQEKLLVVLAKCLKNLPKQVHFQCSYVSGIFFQEFCPVGHYFYYILDFQEYILFRTPFFLTPSWWLAYVLQDNRLEESPWYY